MNIKNNIQLLAEMAKSDIEAGDNLNKSYSAVKESYENITESSDDIVTEASDVIVNKIGDEYYVEMINLYPFMKDSGIHSISEALDLVAKANFLPEKAVGLALESQSEIDDFLEAAKAKTKKTKNNSHLKNALDKVDKNNAVAKKLKSKGYKVVKKKSGSKVCPKCGKVASKCTCENFVDKIKASAGMSKASKEISKNKDTMDTIKGAVNNSKNKMSLDDFNKKYAD